jgi:hypothetical protein
MPGSIRLGPLFSDEARFVEAPIGGLPFPVNGLQLLTVVDQQRPQLIEDPLLVPAVDRPMNRRVAAELFGQVVPLATGACSVDHAIQALALVGAGASHTRRRIKFSQQRQEQVVPHLIGGFPDRRERITLRGLEFCLCLGINLGFRLAHASIVGNSRLLG